MNKTDQLRDYLREHIDAIELTHGQPAGTGIPQGALCAQDYLEFAENELMNYSDSGKSERRQLLHLFNTSSNLERAVECEMEAFFQVLNLLPYFKRKVPSFNMKAKFLTDVCILRPRTVERFQIFRTRFTNAYDCPNSEEVGAFYDLVDAIAVNLQGALSLVSRPEIIGIARDEEGEESSRLTMRYDRENSAFHVEWENFNVEEEPEEAETEAQEEQAPEEPAQEEQAPEEPAQEEQAPEEPAQEEQSSEEHAQEAEAHHEEQVPEEHAQEEQAPEEHAPAPVKKRGRKRKTAKKEVRPPEKHVVLTCASSEAKDFLYFFKAWLLLSQATGYASRPYIAERIKS